jgi:feruloyl-CoA synthase
LPGFELKLTPSGAKLEARIRGPNVTPGYWRRPELTRDAFDEEGFYRTGDAVKLVDPARPAAGLAFDGRVAEDFKLATGTWVSVGPLRQALLAALAPLCRDAALAGADRDRVGALLFLDPDACRRVCGLGPQVDDAALTRAREVMSAVIAALRRHNATNPGSSARIACAVLIAEPPSAALGEVNDKGYLNQAAVLARRAELVASMFAESSPEGVLYV